MSDEKKKVSVEERLAAMEEEMEALKEENEILKIKVDSTPYDRKDDDDGPGNDNVMLYPAGSKKPTGGKQFHPADVKAALKSKKWIRFSDTLKG
jgi:hypothetical protein